MGPGQHDNEAAILGNVYGSSRYVKFLAGLGRLVRLRDCPAAEIYTGGLDRGGADGEFAYSWQDDICQGVYQSTNICYDERLTLETSANLIFTAFNISKSNLR